MTRAPSTVCDLCPKFCNDVVTIKNHIRNIFVSFQLDILSNRYLKLNRRHLTATQRATVAVDMLPLLEEEAKERQKQAVTNRHAEQRGIVTEKIPQLEKGESRVQAAKLVGTNRQYVSDAKKICKYRRSFIVKERLRLCSR